MKRDNVKTPKCWICKDDGLVIYQQKINEISYEFAARCRCSKGLNYGERIPIVDEQFAELVAEGNFKRFRERYPEIIESQAM